MAFIGNQPTAVPLTSSQLVDGIITTGKIADGAVVNVDVNSTAAIAYSKLNLGTSIVNADINASAAIALSKLATTGTMTFASTIGVGGATPAASGAGITFPATASASSDANTLDDYEEGTWTPTDNSGASLTFTNVNGYYTKIGMMVYCAFRLTYPSTANGSVCGLVGLPFTSANLADAVWGGYITYTQYTTAPIQFLINNNTTQVAFFRNGDTNGPTNSEMSTKALRGVIVYQAT